MVTSEPATISVRVLFFARARELTNEKSLALTVPVGTTPLDAFSKIILQKFPALDTLAEHVVLALNQTYLSEGSNTALRDGDELAVIPPISGG